MEEKESATTLSKSAKKRQRKKAKEQQKANKQSRAGLVLNADRPATQDVDSKPANVLTGLQEILGNIDLGNSEGDVLYCPVLKQSFSNDGKSLESKLKTIEPEKFDPNAIWKVIQEERETEGRRDASGLACYGNLCRASDFFAARNYDLKEIESPQSCESKGGSSVEAQTSDKNTENDTSVKKKKGRVQKPDKQQAENIECDTNISETTSADPENITEESSEDNPVLSAISNLQASIGKVLDEIRVKDVREAPTVKMGNESIESQDVALDDSGMSKAQLRAMRKQQKAQLKAVKVHKSSQKDTTGPTQKEAAGPTQKDAAELTQKDVPAPALEAKKSSSPDGTGGSETKNASKEASAPNDTTKTQTEQGKSKAQLKKERRELQEAQRAAKLAEKQGKEGTPTAPKKTGEKESVKQEKSIKEATAASRKGSDGSGKQQIARVPDAIQVDDPVVEKKLAKKLASQQVPQRTSALRKVKLFRHLEQYDSKMSLTHTLPLVGGTIHPAVIKVGLQMSEGMIRGSNAMCIAMLSALKSFIKDYTVAEGKELRRDLETRLKPQVSFLKQCRDLSVSMGNAIRFLKLCITQLPQEASQNEARKSLVTSIAEFVEEKIILAEKAICDYALEKIHDNDVILTYGWSSAVLEVLKYASSSKRDIHVVVVDGRAHLDGKCLLQKLVKLGIPCSYCMLGAVPYHMPQVTKVMVGAHALLANGYVLSDCGMSQVALMAHSFNTPLLVCCETYKFCERVQTDAFVFNELGDPDDLVSTSINKEPLKNWRDLSSLTLLNLHYDVTPPQLVSGVITELGMLPCTSVPVVLRLKYQTPV